MQTIARPFTVLPALNNIYKRPLAAHAQPKGIALFCLILSACIGCSTVLNVMDQGCFERHSLGADEVINKVRRLCIYKLNSWRVCQTRVYHSQTVFDGKQFARHSFSLFVGIRLKSTNKQDNDRNSPNRLFRASHSGGTKPPCWRARDALGQDKQRALNKFLYLSCPGASPCSPAWWFCTT